MLEQIYSGKMALLTDLYQLTMVYGYWKNQRTEDEAVFNLFYRKAPFNGNYAVAAGLEFAIGFLKNLQFEAEDLEYLATLTGNDGQPLFEQAFLEYLANLKFSCDVDALPEGTLVFPHEPIMRIKGTLIQCQLLETALLNMVNFQTLCATKATRVCLATRGEPVLEFGLRRAQGIDGALSASRAAYIGGCAATSNVQAGKLFGIPVKGTHAHSWVMSFDSEEEAFDRYANAMPNNCVFLVDTYDTIEGVKKAIEVGKKLRERGSEMMGIRLDSGDLAELSIQSRRLLEEAGFPDAKIVASNDLDEYAIDQLKNQGAKINVWGVGTKLVTAYDQPALGGVYKLSAIRCKGGEWQYRVKLSEEKIKVSNPGIQQVRRFHDADGVMQADGIYNEMDMPDDDIRLLSLGNPDEGRTIELGTDYEDLLVPIFKKGKLVYDLPKLDAIRTFCMEQIKRLPPEVGNAVTGKPYFVGLEQRLDQLKTKLILNAKEKAEK